MTNLPRGRHKLTRDDVRSVQRARIVDALCEAMSQFGFAETPVAKIISAAGVSRETFYQLFTSKQDAFAAALADTVTGLSEHIDAGAAGADDARSRVRASLAGYLGALDAEPARARLFLIETYAAGPAAMRTRLDLQRLVSAQIAEVTGASAPRCEAFVAAVVGLVTARFVEPEKGAAGDLLPELVELAQRLLF